ncbi:MAG: T9SS type A sorting domain-containing protein [Bacteroidales bacterium]|nr:T9SS type A sorting domain-containing protein [Bacteroidales bacterium]
MMKLHYRKIAYLIIFLGLLNVSHVHSQVIIADHAIIDDYDIIPQQYIDSVKKMWVSVPGQSHSLGYRIGLQLLEDVDSRFQVNINESGLPESQTDQYLRFNRATWGNLENATGWIYDYGEEDWFTSQAAVNRTKDGILYAASGAYELDAMGFGWCYDMCWLNSPGGDVDQEHQVRWAGSSVGGPQGNMRWGLNREDSLLTGNSVSMDTYIAATEEYILFCEENGLSTRVFFTTGPVDAAHVNKDELGYQRHLKTEYIRKHVKARGTGFLFDYDDILCWNDAGEKNLDDWTDHAGIIQTFGYIHPDNMLDLDGNYVEDGDHIGEVGTVRLAKAMWWMLARMSGWDGLPEGQADKQAPTVPENLSIDLISPTTINISWNPSLDNVAVEGYIIYRDDVLLDSIKVCEYVDSTLSLDANFSYQVVAFDAYSNLSSRSDAIIFNMQDYLIDYNNTFLPGFNWFSINSCLPDMTISNFFSAGINEGDYIKGQVSSSTYYEDVGWFGSLHSLDPKELYQIKVQDTCSLIYAGIPLHEHDDQIILNEGWNWIGYTLIDPISIQDAFTALSLHHKDYLKNHTHSATYYDEYGWFGTLTILEPGSGYMLRVSGQDTLDYPPVMIPESTKKKQLNSIRSTNIFEEFRKYEYNGSVTAEIAGDLSGYSDEGKLYAFSEAECRGIATSQYFEPLQKRLFTIMIYSNEMDGEPINFKYWDADKEAFYTIDESVTFKKDMVIADAYEPLALTLSEESLSLNDNADNGRVKIYPNPFKERLLIKISGFNGFPVDVVLYDLTGRIAYQGQIMNDTENQISFSDVELLKGIYFLNVRDANITMTRKVLHQ